MQALAGYIMRGRFQAALVAMIGSLFPLISAATVGLVSLRRGLAEGLFVFLWALLPLLLAYYSSEVNPVVVLTSIAVLLVIPLSAEVLKASVSWRHTLLFACMASGLAGASFGVLFDAEMHLTQQGLAQILAEMQKSAPEAVAFVPDEHFLQGLVGYLIALQVVMGLLLARWWQSLLYNPGGFQSEFHQLRLSPVQAVILVVAVGYCQLTSPQLLSWSALLGLPLLLCGIALVHYLVASRKMGGHWLVIFYIGLITVSPMSLILVVLGFIDSIANLRTRIPAKSE